MLKKYTIFGFLLLFSLTSFAKKQDNDAVFKLISKSYTLNDDGSMDYHERKELQIFTTMTFDIFGETFIDYNTDFQTLKINEAYVIRKDGSKVETPKNAFNPMLPGNCTRCERLNSIREMVVTHTALEHGATIVLDYTVHSDNFFITDIFETIELCQSVPVEKFQLSVCVPKDYSLNWHLNLGEITYTKSKSSLNGKPIEEWIFINLPSKPDDEYLFRTDNPTVTFFTNESIENITAQIFRQQAFHNFEDEGIDRFFKKLIAEKESDLDKINAVKDYVADNISTKEINPKLLNCIFASPQYVWGSNCALPIEKNILLAGVLKNLGYDAEIVYDAMDFLFDFNTNVLVRLDGQNRLISAGDAVKETKVTPRIFVTKSGNVVYFEMIPTEIDIEKSLTLPQNSDKTLKTGTIDEKNISVISEKITTPHASHPYPGSVRISDVGGLYLINIHNGNLGTQLQSEKINRNRKYDIKAGNTSEKYIYHIQLPDGYSSATSSYSKEYAFEGAKMVDKVTINGQTIDVERELVLPKSISAKNAKKMKEMLGNWQVSKQVVVKKNK